MSPAADPHFHSLPPAGKTFHSGGADEEKANFSKHPKIRTPARSNKFLVYLLSLTVILACFILGFAAVARPKSLQLRLTGVAGDNLSLNRSNANVDPSASPASLNGTLVAALEMGNPNFGRFEYRNSTVAVVYGDAATAVLGQEVVTGGRIPIKATRELRLRIEVGDRISGEDVRSGVVKLRCVGEISGRVYFVWERLNWLKTSYLNCGMKLRVSTMAIEDVDCK